MSIQIQYRYCLRFVFGGFLLLLAQSSCAQQLKGRVVTNGNSPLSGAVVVLRDSLTGQQFSAVSDSIGTFIISGKTGNPAILTVSFSGYENYRSVLASPVPDLGSIILIPSVQRLQDVSVNSETKTVTLKEGNLVFNVAGSVVAQGGDALDILRKVPGIVVDNDSRISLQGRASPMVMIDGKQTYLSGKELADLLRATPASQIRSVEVITSPGAKYDAAGTAGIIDIKTNKTRQRGLSATINTGLLIGVTPKQATDLNFQYRTNKITLYGAYNHFFGHYFYQYGADRLQLGQEYKSATDDIDKRNRYGGRIGIDYAIDKKQTIGVMLNSNFIVGGGITDTRTLIGPSGLSTISSSLRSVNDYYYQRTERYTWNANYRYDNERGTTLGIDADLGRFNKGNGNLQSNLYNDGNGNFVKDNHYHSLTDIGIDLSAVKVDYTQPLRKGVLEAGIKYSSVVSSNAARFYYRFPSYDSLDDRRTNHFRFNEQITSGYVSYKRSLGKWDYQFGARFEQTGSEGALSFRNGLKDSVRMIARKYTNLFPSFSVSYRPFAGHALSFQYSRRLDRPAYQDLNPFIYLLDELSFWQGDPFLQPQYSHRFSFQYAYKSATIVQLSYSYTSGYSSRITDTFDVNKVVMVPRNLGVQRVGALSLTQIIKPVAWWEIQATGTLTYVQNDVSFDTFRQLNLKQWCARIGAQQNFLLPSAITLEISGYLQSKKLISANEFVSGLRQLDIGIQKRFAKNRGTVRVAVTDLLHTATTNSVQAFSGFQSVNYGYYENRLLRINFSWKLADPNAKTVKAKISALEAEQGRIK